MSMLGRQIKELRALACGLRNLYENGTNLTRVQVAGLTTAVEVMSEVADTIESLRDRLLKAELACDEKSYDAGFDNGMKATLQQLDGLIHEGADVDEIQAWVDRQWEEEI